jgi:hypothetical protein
MPVGLRGRLFCPEGAKENTPGFQLWEAGGFVPLGTE